MANRLDWALRSRVPTCPGTGDQECRQIFSAFPPPALRCSVPWEGPRGLTWAMCVCVHELTPLCLGRVERQSREAEVWNANATSCFCPGFSQCLCLGQPWRSGSLGFSPSGVGGWEGGGAFCWQAPLQTAVLCRCLWPSSVQCQGLEPDSSII